MMVVGHEPGDGGRDLAAAARRVLLANRAGRWTVPARGLYPHQWNWDSAFISMGYATFDQELAQRELLSLFRGQWANGMLPHIVFNPEAAGYFPGPEFWRSSSVPGAPKDVETSGITQPPVHATAAVRIFERAGDRQRALEFLEVLFPKLLALHDYYYAFRDPEAEGLVCVLHPWESGMDNSPAWAGVLSGMPVNPREIPAYHRKDRAFVGAEEERPSDAEYDRFVYLADRLRRRAYDEEEAIHSGLFVVQDPLFNAILIRAETDLLRIAGILGVRIPGVAERVVRARRAMDKLWSQEDGVYHPFDVAGGRPIRVRTAGGFAPLFAGVPSPGQARKMVVGLNSTCFCRVGEGCFALPNYDRCGDGFSSTNYWRGPVWLNINWLIFRGLEAYGFRGYASLVRSSMVRLVQRSGFREYYEPETGRGLGAENFSWTAALLLDVLADSPAPAAPSS